LISTTISLSTTLPAIAPITPTVTATPTKGTIAATATFSGTPPTVPPRPTGTGTPTALAQNPGGTIFYAGFDGIRYSIHSVKADGSLDTSYFGNASEPALSPDGQQVAWRAKSAAAPCANLSVSNLNGSGCYTFANDSSAGYPSFSPDGRSVVYHSIPHAGGTQIFRVTSQCCSDPILIAFGKRPAWQPLSGELVAYDGCKPDGSGCFSIYTTRAIGGDINNPTFITHGTNPSWSPDGKRIAFQDRDESGSTNLFIVGVDGKDRSQITKIKGNNGAPIFSSDGQWLFFLSDQNGAGWAIFAVRTDGTAVTKIKAIGVNPDEWDLGKFAYAR
jgi:dipeptidyl aminopeptidase/acylaminoacyl peptidase